MPESCLAEACGSRVIPAWLVWAITIGEAILLAAMALLLTDYWLMLPVWLRSAGALILASLTLIVVIRLTRFYKARGRLTTKRIRGEGSAEPRARRHDLNEGGKARE